MKDTTESLRIAHSSQGKFHHQDLARQLYRLNTLGGFFTGYPRIKLKNLGVPADLVHTFPWMNVPYHLGLRYRLLRGRLRREMEWWMQESFDHWLARNLPTAHAYIGLSCASLYAGQSIQQRGGLYLCDRGSSHILTQDQLLAEEYARQGIPYQSIDPRVIEKEMAEYATADAILVPSEFARQSFLQQGVPEDRLRKVPYGVDLQRFSKVDDPDPDAFDVLFVGGVSLQKGVPDLLEAFTKLEHPRKRLRFVGAVSEEMQTLLAKQRMGTAVEFLGPWPQDKLHEIMSRSHVLVLPSIEDGFGLVQAQAMACGCPVIASRHTGAYDLFTDGIEGYIVPIQSPDVLAERLQFLADDPNKRQQMGAASLQRVQHIGGWNQYGESIVTTIEELLHARH
jgi:glycosyltransferase involved in cell wall biosynthesis